MARKFLYFVAAMIVLAIAALLAYRLFGTQLMRAVMVPSETFQAQREAPRNIYARKIMWLARPDAPGNPALWTPPGYTPGERGTGAAGAQYVSARAAILPRQGEVARSDGGGGHGTEVALTSPF
ncbi:MAG: hypothetical protein EOP67_74445, partial [Sphingomonas sp.]